MTPILPDQGSELANGLTALTITIIFAIIMFAFIRHTTDKKFEIWFEDLLNAAPGFGYSQEEIDAFEEFDWFNYFADGLTPEEALKQTMHSI